MIKGNGNEINFASKTKNHFYSLILKKLFKMFEF